MKNIHPLNSRFSMLFAFLLTVSLLAVSFLFMLPGGLLHAQTDGTIDYPENGTGAVATYTASDPEGAMVTWSLAGDDAGDFMIENGVLSFKKSPDFEMPMGSSTNMSNTYTVMVKATDETRMVGMKDVMVKVTNVDEDGMVTLSARRPQSATAFTAMINDPDTGVSDDKWQWAKAGSLNGSYGNITSATSDTYTPKDADLGSYLRATVTYEDAEGEGKSAMMKSEFPVQAIRGANNAPEFAADQDPIMMGDQPAAKREVAENTEAGKTVGSPVTATDEDGDTLTYTLTDGDGGTDGDSAAFTIDWATGQIMTKDDLDHETGGTYDVVVRATDPTGMPGADPAVTDNSDTVMVMITVTDKNEAPTVTGDPAVTFNETTGVITTLLGSRYTATDQDADPPVPTWTVGGADRSEFTVVDGDLKFKKKPDYERPTDANMDNVYEVMVQASDARLTGMMNVMVTVENAEEEGVVTLSKVQPRVGIPVTAMLEDPDGSISKLTWQWSISQGDITDAMSDTYTPKAGDVNGTLTATASYFDGESAPGATTKKTALKVADNAVAADTRNLPPAFGDEDSDTDGVQNTMAMRKVEENTEASDDAVDDGGDNVGSPVMATDPDPNSDALTYTLSGADAAKFRVRDNGQIKVAAGTMLDYETKQTYSVTLTAEDSFGATASIAVTIMVTDLDEAPAIVAGLPEVLVITGASNPSYPENGTTPVATYTLSGPNAASATWTLEGPDASDFAISSRGVLTFKSSPDYETKTTYMVTVKASVGSDMDTQDVTITVTDVNDAPLEISGMSNVDYAENGAGPVETYTLSGANAALATWTLEGPDASDFAISSRGVLNFRSSPDYETKITYMVTVKAAYGADMDTHEVTITVTDVEEMAPEMSLLDRYDADGDDDIDLTEVGTAIDDFFSGGLTLAEVSAVIDLFFE